MTLHDYRAPWERHAACAGTDPHLWYGRDDVYEPGWQAHQRRQSAKAVCRSCPVQTECLLDELTRPRSEQHGIRGATTAGERARLLAHWRAIGSIPQHTPPSDTDIMRNLLEGEAQGRAAS